MADSSPQQVTTNIMHKSTPALTQVAFKDIPHSYSPCSPVTCSYTLTAPFQASSRDWVGIFKVGWSTTKDYHTFVWVEPCGDQQPVSRKACFKDYYLPKDDVDFYQFCYVDSTGHVCGASTPFCFKTQTEPSAESTLDNDLWVITTQHQVDESVREKAALKEAADRIREKNEEMQKDLQDERRQVGVLEEQKKQHSQEKSELERELSEMKAQNQRLENTVQQQKQEMDSLKEMLAQMTSQMQIQEKHAGSTPGCDDEGGGGEGDDGRLGQTELELREAQAAIAEKEVLMEEKEHLMLTIRHQNDMLTQENQNLRRDVEELRRMLKELPAAAPTHTPQHEVTAPPGGELTQSDAGQTRDPSYDDLPVVSITEDEDEDQPVLSCRHCLESFPGMSRAEVEEHERNHQVCPFCTLICDNMEQSVFEDHVYSHEM
ncbi:calcium-binding and coiled-coil domain-containing protein 2 isoform X2 [Nerophis ophidion]|uniref:calcium-binding and coiled-coil domain-containing protein 2 isoform X2 n=1 Tax=Nerophis ophidion TaxID=159077 RepID=UPI002AE07651|nr:calcium-binding and coiled-coil domain-containing protein 2 isoform X2 [Nerophis ophidion]